MKQLRLLGIMLALMGVGCGEDAGATGPAGVRATRHRDHLDRRIVTTKIGAS
jgi:hypothetical protein